MRIDDLATRIRIGEDARLALKEVSFEDRSVSAPRREQLMREHLRLTLWFALVPAGALTMWA